MRARRSVPFSTVMAAAVGGWLAVFVALQLMLAHDPETPGLVVAALMLPLDVIVIGTWLAAARAARADRRTAAAWIGLAVAMALMLVGDVLWTLQLGSGATSRFPSVADLAYLGSLVVAAPALAIFRSRSFTRVDRMRFALDTAIVMLVGVMVAWQFVLARLTAEADAAATVLSAAHLLGDMLLLFGLSMVALRQPRPSDRRALRLLMLGMLLFLVADVAFARDISADDPAATAAADVLVALATICFASAGVAAVRDRDRAWAAEADATDHLVAALPYLALFAGWLLLIAVAWSGGEDEVLITLAGLLTMLVVARQLIVVRENQKLTAEQGRRAGEEHFRALVQHATDLITVTDPAGAIRMQTPSLSALLGYPPDGCVGLSLMDLVHPDDQAAFEGLLATARAGTAATPHEIRLRHRDGYWVPTDTSVDDLSGEPAVRGLVLTSRDIRERKALEERLVHQALHDPLTGLPNRTMFRDRVQQALHRATREVGLSLWVLFLDIDDFKSINDRMGHEVGDRLLQAFAERLSMGVRPEDTPARLGGDEFAIAMARMPDAATVVERAQRLLDSLSRPYVVAGTELRATVSIGVAEARAGELDPQRVLRDADAAMYQAKAAGRNRVSLAGADRPVPLDAARATVDPRIP